MRHTVLTVTDTFRLKTYCHRLTLPCAHGPSRTASSMLMIPHVLSNQEGLTGDARLEFLRNSGPAPEMQMERAGQ